MSYTTKELAEEVYRALPDVHMKHGLYITSEYKDGAVMVSRWLSNAWSDDDELVDRVWFWNGTIYRSKKISILGDRLCNHPACKIGEYKEYE